MIPITGGGVFTRKNIADLNANFAEAQAVDIYVDPQNGLDSNDGSKGAPKATVGGCSALMEPGLRIGIRGVLFEEFSSPIVANVSLIGLGNQPLQGTTSGAPNGGGTTWLSPTGGTGVLLKLNGQGWRVQNIYFNNSAAQPDIQIVTAGDPPTAADGAHAQILGCVFTGADAGIQASGGTNFVTIVGNTFFNFTGSGDTAIEQVTGAGIGTLLGWQVTDNVFYNNVNGIILPSTCSFYYRNTFVSAGASVTATTLLSLTSGTKNDIRENYFGLASNASGIATIVAMGTSPTAGPNYYTDASEFGQPAE